jgi:hypothetical protein
MLQYLDNAQNAAGHSNENYARELLELHTLGVGSGYTQQDIQELARVLTGVGVNASGNEPKLKPEWQKLYRHQGAFEFNPARPDFRSSPAACISRWSSRSYRQMSAPRWITRAHNSNGVS